MKNKKIDHSQNSSKIQSTNRRNRGKNNYMTTHGRKYRYAIIYGYELNFTKIETFSIWNFPFACSNIPATPAYVVYYLSVDTIYLWFQS